MAATHEVVVKIRADMRLMLAAFDIMIDEMQACRDRIDERLAALVDEEPGSE